MGDQIRGNGSNFDMKIVLIVTLMGVLIVIGTTNTDKYIIDQIINNSTEQTTHETIPSRQQSDNDFVPDNKDFDFVKTLAVW